MPTMTKPVISPTSGLDQHSGAKIADYVRDDALSEIKAVTTELLRRGCSDIGIHLFNGKQIADISNRWRSCERGYIPVAGIGARRGWSKNDGTDRVSLMLYWHVASGLVSANWDVLEAGDAPTV